MVIDEGMEVKTTRDRGTILSLSTTIGLDKCEYDEDGTSDPSKVDTRGSSG